MNYPDNGTKKNHVNDFFQNLSQEDTEKLYQHMVNILPQEDLNFFHQIQQHLESRYPQAFEKSSYNESDKVTLERETHHGFRQQFLQNEQFKKIRARADEIIRFQNSFFNWLNCCKAEYQELSLEQKRLKWINICDNILLENPELQSESWDNSSQRESKLRKIWQLAEPKFIDPSKNPEDLLQMNGIELMVFIQMLEKQTEQLNGGLDDQTLLAELNNAFQQRFGNEWVPKKSAELNLGVLKSSIREYEPENQEFMNLLDNVLEEYDFSEKDPLIGSDLRKNQPICEVYASLDAFTQQRLSKLVRTWAETRVRLLSPHFTNTANPTIQQYHKLQVLKEQQKIYQQSFGEVENALENADPILYGPKNAQQARSLQSARQFLQDKYSDLDTSDESETSPFIILLRKQFNKLEEEVNCLPESAIFLQNLLSHYTKLPDTDPFQNRSSASHREEVTSLRPDYHRVTMEFQHSEFVTNSSTLDPNYLYLPLPVEGLQGAPFILQREAEKQGVNAEEFLWDPSEVPVDLRNMISQDVEFSEEQTKVDRVIEISSLLCKDRQFDEAIELVKTELLEQPNNLSLLVECGCILSLDNQFSEAEEFFEKALDSSFELNVATLYAPTLAFLEKYERGRMIFQKMAKSYPKNAQAYYWLGFFLNRSGYAEQGYSTLLVALRHAHHEPGTVFSDRTSESSFLSSCLQTMVNYFEIPPSKEQARRNNLTRRTKHRVNRLAHENQTMFNLPEIVNAPLTFEDLYYAWISMTHMECVRSLLTSVEPQSTCCNHLFKALQIDPRRFEHEITLLSGDPHVTKAPHSLTTIALGFALLNESEGHFRKATEYFQMVLSRDPANNFALSRLRQLTYRLDRRRIPPEEQHPLYTEGIAPSLGQFHETTLPFY